jgi:FkbM family methyltransferase
MSKFLNAMFRKPPAPAAVTPSLQDLRFLFARMSRSQCEDYIRRKTKRVAADDETMLCHILSKYEFYVQSDDIGFGLHMAKEGYWEYWLTQFFVETVQPGDTVLDIGANHGYYSILSADLVGPSGKVICVEANPNLCKLLSWSLEANHFGARAQILNIALTDDEAPSEQAFFIPKNEPKNGCLLHPHQDLSELRTLGEVIPVEARRMTAEELPKLDFVKIDVEGAEMAVLRGLAPILMQHRPKMIIEVNFGRGYTYHELAGLFEHQATFRHLDTDAKLKPVTEEMCWTERFNEDWLFYVDWTESSTA